MDFIPEEIARYTEAYTKPESPVLRQLNRETQAHVLMPRMLSGHLQGRVLSMLSHMVKPSLILEIGTYTGYSALCLAEGLRKGGTLHTIDINEELDDMVHEFIRKAGFSDQIITHTGEAVKIIPELPGKFDLVFIDADKENYSLYYDLVFPRVNIGGYIIADNVLWSGNILKPLAEMDEETASIAGFNKKILSDTRVENVLFPVRDGLMVIRKVSE